MPTTCRIHEFANLRGGQQIVHWSTERLANFDRTLEWKNAKGETKFAQLEPWRIADVFTVDGLTLRCNATSSDGTTLNAIWMLNGEDVSDGKSSLALNAQSSVGEYRCVATVPGRSGIGDLAWTKHRRELLKSKSSMRSLENADGGLTTTPLGHPEGHLTSPPIRLHSLIDENIYFERRPISVTSSRNATVRLRCSLNTAMLFNRLRWVRNGQIVDEKADKMEIMTVSGSSVLHILSLDESTAGDYKCVLEGTDLESDPATVAIASGDSKWHWYSGDKGVNIEEADDLILDCLPKNPIDNVTWFKDDLSFSTGNFLVFRGIKKTDAGRYRCRSGLLSRNITVAIKEIPTMNPGQQLSVESQREGATVRLNCDGTVAVNKLRYYEDAEDRVTLSYQRADFKIQPKGKFKPVDRQFNRNQTHSVLGRQMLITDLEAADEALYECIVTTKNSEQSQARAVFVEPSALFRIRDVHATTGMYDMKWKLPDGFKASTNGKDAQDVFLASFYQSNSGISNSIVMEEVSCEGHQCSARCCHSFDIKPNRYYTIAVSLMYNSTLSPLSSPVEVFSYAQFSREGLEVEAEEVSDGSWRVSWPRNETTEEIHSYWLEIVQKNLTRVMQIRDSPSQLVTDAAFPGEPIRVRVIPVTAAGTQFPAGLHEDQRLFPWLTLTREAKPLGTPAPGVPATRPDTPRMRIRPTNKNTRLELRLLGWPRGGTAVHVELTSANLDEDSDDYQLLEAHFQRDDDRLLTTLNEIKESQPYRLCVVAAPHGRRRCRLLRVGPPAPAAEAAVDWKSEQPPPVVDVLEHIGIKNVRLPLRLPQKVYCGKETECWCERLSPNMTVVRWEYEHLRKKNDQGRWVADDKHVVHANDFEVRVFPTWGGPLRRLSEEEKEQLKEMLFVNPKGVMEVRIPNLNEEMQYKVRIDARNSIGSVEGEIFDCILEKEFGPPPPKLLAARSISDTSLEVVWAPGNLTDYPGLPNSTLERYVVHLYNRSDNHEKNVSYAIEREVDESVTSLIFVDLVPTTYSIRVASIGADGVRGAFSDYQEMKMPPDPKRTGRFIYFDAVDVGSEDEGRLPAEFPDDPEWPTPRSKENQEHIAIKISAIVVCCIAFVLSILVVHVHCIQPRCGGKKRECENIECGGEPGAVCIPLEVNSRTPKKDPGNGKIGSAPNSNINGKGPELHGLLAEESSMSYEDGRKPRGSSRYEQLLREGKLEALMNAANANSMMTASADQPSTSSTHEDTVVVHFVPRAGCSKSAHAAESSSNGSDGDCSHSPLGTLSLQSWTHDDGETPRRGDGFGRGGGAGGRSHPMTSSMPNLNDSGIVYDEHWNLANGLAGLRPTCA